MEKIISCAVDFGSYMNGCKWVSMTYESLMASCVVKARLADETLAEKMIANNLTPYEKGVPWKFVLENVAPKLDGQAPVGVIKVSEMVVVAGKSVRYKTMQEKSILRQTGMAVETDAKRRHLGYFRLSDTSELLHVSDDFSKIYMRAFQKVGTTPKSWHRWIYADGTVGAEVNSLSIAQFLPSKDFNKFCGKDTDSYVKDDDGNIAVLLDENGNVAIDPDTNEPMKIKNVGVMALVIWDENTKRRGVHFKLHGHEIDILDFEHPYNIELLQARKEDFYAKLERSEIDG